MRMAQEDDLMAGLAVVFVDVFKNKMVTAQGDPRTEFFQKFPLQRIAPSFANSTVPPKGRMPFTLP